MIAWIKKYWYIPLAAVGLILLSVLTGRNRLPAILAEVRAADAKAKVKTIEAERGREVAVRAVQETYKARIRRLDLDSQATARELRDDPAKLAAYLERVVK